MAELTYGRGTYEQFDEYLALIDLVFGYTDTINQFRNLLPKLYKPELEPAYNSFNAYLDGKMVAAICAAPSILGKLGMLEGRTAVCYDGFEELLFGATIGEGRTCTDGNLITARGAGVAIEFGMEIVRYFKGNGEARAVGMSMKCKE